MVCFSKIQTMLKDIDRLVEALQQSGYAVERRSGTVLLGKGPGGKRINFDRLDEKSTFVVSGDTSDLTLVNRRYAELGVRTWAVKNGFTVQEKVGNKITLINRRG